MRTWSIVITTPPLHITLLSADQQHIISVGDSAVLDCRFHAVNYNLFDYPVLWRKHQLDEDVQVNVMGNINEPFLTERRFDVTFSAASRPSSTASPARTYSLQLTISGQSHIIETASQNQTILCTVTKTTKYSTWTIETRTTNPTWRMASILENRKSAIFQQTFDRCAKNLAW